jgi:hypothetical protein
VYFDGVGNILASTGWTDGPSVGNVTMFVMGNFTTAGNDAISDYMIEGQYPTGTTNNRFRLLKFHDTGIYQVRVGSGTTINAGTADTEKHVFTIVSGQSGTSVNFWVDDAVLGSGNSGTSVAMQALGLGGYLTGNNQFADCSIAEVLLYNSALTDTDRIIIHNYLAEKYIDTLTCSNVIADGYGIASDISGTEGVSDCRVDIYDFAAMVNDWLSCNDPEGVPDCRVDMYDFAAMANDWLRCNDPEDVNCEWIYQQ